MDKVQPIIAQAATVLRGLLELISPQVAAIAKGLPDMAVVGGVAGAVIVALIVLFTLINMIGALFRPKAKKEKREKVERREAPPQRAARPAPAPAPQRAPSAAAPQRAPDPVQKIKRDAESGVARVKQDTERLVETLLAERDKAVQSGAAFATEIPTRGLQLLAQALTTSDAPALSAARRRIMSGDIDGARADLRRHAQETGGREGAWRNLAVLDCMRDVSATIGALEQARAADGKDFVALVMLRRLYSGVGQPQQAHDAGVSAVAAARDDRERAIGLDELGVACMHLKDGAGARKAMLESLEIVERLATRAPKDIERQRDVAVGHYKIATLGGPDARERLVSAIAGFERLSKISKLAPADVEALSQLKAVLADMDKERAGKK
jgi:hypothetical protein